MLELRANTQVRVPIGPAVAVGDGFVPITTLTLSGADEAELIKYDSTGGVDVSGRTFVAYSTTAVDGYKLMTLTTGDTDTEGGLTVVVQDDSLILPIRNDFMVLSEAAWDSKYVAKDTGFMDVNVKAINESTQAAINQALAAEGIIAGIAETGTLSTTQCSTDLTGYLADELEKGTLIFTGGTAAGQRTKILNFAVTNGVLTYEVIQTAPANNDPFVIV